MTVVTVTVPENVQAAIDALRVAGIPRDKVYGKYLANHLETLQSAAETLSAEARARETLEQWLAESDDEFAVDYREQASGLASKREQYVAALKTLDDAADKLKADALDSRVSESVNADDSAVAAFEYDAAKAGFAGVVKNLGDEQQAIFKAFVIPTSGQLISGRKTQTATTDGEKVWRPSFESITFDGKVLTADTLSGAALETKVGTAKFLAERLQTTAGTRELTNGETYTFTVDYNNVQHTFIVVPTTKARGKRGADEATPETVNA